MRRDVHGVAVEIACDDTEAAGLVARRLSAFPECLRGADILIEIGADMDVDSPPEEARVVHETARGLVVYSDELDMLWIDYAGATARCTPGRGTGSIAYERGREGWQWVATRPLLTRPLLTLTLMELLKRRSLYPVHAAAAARGGDAVLFAGESGSGKSTAVLSLLLAGWRVLGDDLLFLTAGERCLRALGFPDEIDAAPATIARFPELGPPHRWPDLTGYPKRQLQFQRLHAHAVALAATPQLVLLPQIADRPDHALEPLAPDALLRELLPNVVLTEPGVAQVQLDLLAGLARTVPAFRLHFGRDLVGLGDLVGSALVAARRLRDDAGRAALGQPGQPGRHPEHRHERPSG